MGTLSGHRWTKLTPVAQEQVGQQRRVGDDGVATEVGQALGRQHHLVDEVVALRAA